MDDGASKNRAAFGADAAQFQIGWFIESLCTQVLVIFVIRARRSFWRSRPHPLLLAVSLSAAVVGVALPLSPLAALFGFVAPPASYYLFLVAAVAGYIAVMEITKNAFFRWVAQQRSEVELGRLDPVAR